MVLEPVIYGDYVKFSSNSGFILDGYTAPEVFTHYTWHKTRELIVCDLQGVRQITGDANDAYYFTDPAINSLRQTWGPTDMGPTGIVNFFKSHTCSKFCNTWVKPLLPEQAKPLQVIQKTTYAASSPSGGAKPQPGMDTELAQLFGNLLARIAISGGTPPVDDHTTMVRVSQKTTYAIPRIPGKK